MLRYAKYVFAVYEERSFSKAAKKLFISQPSLSAMVKKAEEQLGTPIFDRSTNPIHLTQAGEAYIRAIQQVQDAEGELMHALWDIQTLRTGRLRIGTNHVFAAYVLPSLLGKYATQYPGVEVTLTEGTVLTLRSKLAAGELDLLLDHSLPTGDDYLSKPVGQEHLLLAAAALPEPSDCRSLTHAQVVAGVHRDIQYSTTPLAVFAQGRFVLLREGNDTRHKADQLFQAAGFTPKVSTVVEQMATAYRVICGSTGLTFVSDTLIRRTTALPHLRYYKLEPLFALRDIYVCRRRTQYLTRTTEVFLEMMEHMDWL